MPEWFIGFISGVSATIIGFGLTIFWDFIKFKGELKKKEKALWFTTGVELMANIFKLGINLELLKKEIEILGRYKGALSPLKSLQKGLLYDFLKTFSHKLGFEAVTKIQIADLLIEQINDIIRSRENYRIFNEPHFEWSHKNFERKLESLHDFQKALEETLAQQMQDSFYTNMRAFDQKLLEDSEKLHKILEGLRPLLGVCESSLSTVLSDEIKDEYNKILKELQPLF